MAIVKLDMTEFNDVIDVLHQRGVEFAISIEPDGAFLYGTQDLVEQVDDILWARRVMPFVCSQAADMAYSMPKI